MYNEVVYEAPVGLEIDMHEDATIESGDTRFAFRFVKRVFDIVFSAIVISILFIPCVILCIAIRIESKGSPIYIQKRVKRSSHTGDIKTFRMFKFRSMVKGSDQMLEQLRDQNEATWPLFKMKNDPRITKIGKFIRKHSIDELPQFINVFLGQMSVVGPRPPLPEEVEQYDRCSFKRLSIKPGITGYWQIRGRSDLTFDEMVECDIKYIEERSFSIDLLVVVKTVAIVINGNGAR